MPIGFWSVSREELRFWTSARVGYTPSRQTLDSMVRHLPIVLDYAIEDTIDEFAPLIIEEQDKE